MNKLIIIIALLTLSLRMYSQDIKIEFSRIDNERCTDVQDQNGQQCALIRVTTSQDLVFDVGILGIVKSEKTGTGYNIYVPAGVKRITISKQGLETLREKDLGMSTQKGGVYGMVVRTSMDLIYQVARIKMTPKSAMVLIEATDADSKFSSQSFQDASGTVTPRLPVGNYKYTAMAAGYQAEKGTFVLTEDAPRTIVIDMQREQESAKPAHAASSAVSVAGNTSVANTNAFKQRFGARVVLKDSYSAKVSLLATSASFTKSPRIATVSSITSGGAFDKAGIMVGFIIDTINGKEVRENEEIQQFSNENTLEIVGHYPNSKEVKSALKAKRGSNPPSNYFERITYTVKAQ